MSALLEAYDMKHNASNTPFHRLEGAFHADGGKYGDRLGQWFINRFRRGVDHSLFYEKDNAKALEIIKQMYVDYQWPM